MAQARISMSPAFKIVAVIYLIGVITCGALGVHGTYVTGGFQREHSASDILLHVMLDGTIVAIWPAFIVLLIMGSLGALHAHWELSFFKIGLLVLLFVAMAIGTWAVTHVRSPTKYAGHAELRNRLAPLIGSELVELKMLVLALLIGIGLMLSLTLL
ncbi:hypothetical protein ACQR1I_12270 [Bradyrhizobium sp. HKCCYLS2038]|uniref:hypothetical protein n=1 Tax=unclassified Bradyrhizobium TaxID=2631580 RepID=UPI003EB6D9AE